MLEDRTKRRHFCNWTVFARLKFLVLRYIHIYCVHYTETATALEAYTIHIEQRMSWITEIFFMKWNMCGDVCHCIGIQWLVYVLMFYCMCVMCTFGIVNSNIQIAVRKRDSNTAKKDLFGFIYCWDAFNDFFLFLIWKSNNVKILLFFPFSYFGIYSFHLHTRANTEISQFCFHTGNLPVFHFLLLLLTLFKIIFYRKHSHKNIDWNDLEEFILK